MAFNSDDHVDHAGYAAEANSAREKFQNRNQWMTDELLRDSRIENKKANTRFALGLENHGWSAHWTASVDLWWSRYDSTLTKAYGGGDPRGNTDNPPTGEGITLVLSTFAAQLRSPDRNAETGEFEPVMLGTIQTGFLALMCKFSIKHPDWKPNSFERSLLRNMFARLVKEGIVRVERSQRLRSSLPLRSAIIILRRYLVRALAGGVRSPDGLVNDLLIFTLLCATGARAGDVASVRGEAKFGSHCILMEDIVLQVAGHSANPVWADLRCQITVKWFKTNGLQTRPPQIHRLSALNEDHALLDPICWILVHCRQRTLLSADCPLQTILNRAAARGDRRIIFDPSAARQPLLLRLSPNDVYGSALADGAHLKPAPSEFLGSRITQMGFLAGALQPLGAHSLRRGTAEDLLALGNDWTTGATASSSIVLGHGDQSQRKGLTSYYADNATTELLNARTEKLITSPPSNMLEYDDGLTGRTPITAQAPTLQDDRERNWLYSETMTNLRKRQPHLSNADLKGHARSLAVRLNREAHLAGMSPRAYLEQMPDPYINDPISAPAITPTASILNAEETSAWDEQDPSMLATEGDTASFLASNNIGSGMALANVVASDINTICEDVLNYEGTDLSQVHLAAAESQETIRPDGEPMSHEVLSMGPQQLVQFFTAYNIIKKSGKQSDADLARYRREGKDSPQFMVYMCAKGCGYSSTDRYYVLVVHECKPHNKIVRPYRKKEDSGPDLTRSIPTNATVYGRPESTTGQAQLVPQILPSKRTHAMAGIDETENSSLPRTESPHDGAETGAQKRRIELPRMARCPYAASGCKAKAFTNQHDLRVHLRTRKHGYSDEDSAAKARELWEAAVSPGWLEAP
ncbi:hypothetical protein LTR95_003100 [Oleoguttula sp. CCFEE 5521]